MSRKNSAVFRGSTPNHVEQQNRSTNIPAWCAGRAVAAKTVQLLKVAVLDDPAISRVGFVQPLREGRPQLRYFGLRPNERGGDGDKSVLNSLHRTTVTTDRNLWVPTSRLESVQKRGSLLLRLHVYDHIYSGDEGDVHAIRQEEPIVRKAFGKQVNDRPNQDQAATEYPIELSRIMTTEPDKLTDTIVQLSKNLPLHIKLEPVDLLPAEWEQA